MGRIIDSKPTKDNLTQMLTAPFYTVHPHFLLYITTNTSIPPVVLPVLTHPWCLSNHRQMGSGIFARLRFSCKIATHESSLFFYVIFASGLQQQWLPAWWSLKGKILVYAIRHPLAWSLCLYGLIKLRNISVWCKKASFSLQVCGLQHNKAEEYFHDWKSQIRTTFSA